MTHGSHEPVTRETLRSGGLIMFLVAVDDGTPVISDRKDDEKIMSGLTAVMAAVSLERDQDERFTYTHQAKERICPRSAGV